MPVGIKHRRPLNPIVMRVNKAIAEAVAFANPTAQYVAESSVVAEASVQAQGVLLHQTSSSVIGEAISALTFSNQKSSQSSVIAEALSSVGLVGASTGSVGIDIYDEGVLVKANAEHIDIVGADARADADGDGAKIWHPAPDYTSNWNTTDGTNDATVADIATVNRIISTPAGGEGMPFFTDGNAEASYATTRTDLLVWSSANECSFIDDETTFEITILDGDSPQGTEETFETSAITGDGVYSGTNITVTISNWVANGDKYSADVSISVDIDSIFPNGGYFDISMTHHNGADGDFTKSQ